MSCWGERWEYTLSSHGHRHMEDRSMFPLRSYRYPKSRSASIVVILLGSWVGFAQQSRRVDDAALKTGSRTGDEWISYGVNWAEQRFSPLKQIDAVPASTDIGPTGRGRMNMGTGAGGGNRGGDRGRGAAPAAGGVPPDVAAANAQTGAPTAPPQAEP